MKVQAPREDFGKRELQEGDLTPKPIDLFERWWQEAIDAHLIMPDAAVLSTIDNDQAPNARVIFIKNFDDRGLVFFTNYNSAKGRELEYNNKAHLTILWADFERQVRIKGSVVKTSREESAQYFHERPRGSQLGAWASRQSEEIASREELHAAYKHAEQQFLNKEIPCPPHWGGYRLQPDYFEFWQGRSNRLHDRIVYRLDNFKKWFTVRVCP